MAIRLEEGGIRNYFRSFSSSWILQAHDKIQDLMARGQIWPEDGEDWARILESRQDPRISKQQQRTKIATPQ